MKKKKILAAALAAAMVLAMPLTVSANWQQDATGNWSWTEDGTKATGWKQVGSTWYYFNADGVMQTGWQKYNNNWYYMQPSGAMSTGWAKVDGKWYFMKDWGGMATGWVKTGDKWYHMQPSGEMSTGKVEINGATYFLGDANDGALRTGFITEGDKTYFSSEYGVQTGVVEVNGDVYYFDKEDGGAMVTGSTTIDGKTYNFSEDGVCTSRTKPEADVAFETTGDGSTVTPVTPGSSTGDNTGSGSGGGSTGGDTGSTGGDTGTTTPTLNIIDLTFDEPDADGGDANHTNIGRYTVSNDNNTVTVTATSDLRTHTAQHGPQTDGKWVGVKIHSSVPVAELSYWSSTAGGSFSTLESEPTVDNENTFVYWFDASVAVDGPRIVKLAARDHVEAEIKVNFVGLDSKLEDMTPTDALLDDVAAFASPGNPGKDYFANKVECSVSGTTVSVTSKTGATIAAVTDNAKWTGFNTAEVEEQTGYYVLITLKAPAGVPAGYGKLIVGSATGPKTVNITDNEIAIIAHYADRADLDTPRTWTIDWDGTGATYAPVEYTIDCSGVNIAQ